MSADIALLSLTAVANGIAQKRFSSREVTKSCLDRIAQWQPSLNAFMAIEAETALAAADAALSSRSGLMSHNARTFAFGCRSTPCNKKDPRLPVPIIAVLTGFSDWYA